MIIERIHSVSKRKEAASKGIIRLGAVQREALKLGCSMKDDEVAPKDKVSARGRVREMTFRGLANLGLFTRHIIPGGGVKYVATAEGRQHQKFYSTPGWNKKLEALMKERGEAIRQKSARARRKNAKGTEAGAHASAA